VLIALEADAERAGLGEHVGLVAVLGCRSTRSLKRPETAHPPSH
jgi:hypothetical protein